MKKTILYILCGCLLLSSYGQVSQEITDVITLSRAGITNTIIKAYIEGFTNRFSIQATNIIQLKNANVPNDVISYLVEKRNTLELLYVNKLEKVTVVNTYMDGKDFFYQYYLIPRAENASDEMRNKKVIKR